MMSERILWGVPSFWIERLPLYFGRHKGFFRELGIDLTIRYFWGGPELAAAVEKGEIRIGDMGLLPFSKAFSQGLPARVIGSSVIQQLDHYFVGAPGLRNIQSLKGKRVGILSYGSCDDYFLRIMLKRNGMDAAKDITTVPLGDSYGKLESFSSGLVDAGFLVEPFVALGESKGLIKVITSVKNYFPRYQWGVLFAGNHFIQESKDVLLRALQAYRKSCNEIRKNQDEAVAFGAQVFQLKKGIFRKALLRDLANWEFETRIDMEGMENCIRIQKEIGAVSHGVEALSMIWNP